MGLDGQHLHAFAVVVCVCVESDLELADPRVYADAADGAKSHLRGFRETPALGNTSFVSDTVESLYSFGHVEVE